MAAAQMSNRQFRSKNFVEPPTVDVQNAFKKYTKQLKIITPQFPTNQRATQPVQNELFEVKRLIQAPPNHSPSVYSNNFAVKVSNPNLIHQHRVNNNFSTISEQPNMVYQLKSNNPSEVEFLKKRSNTSQSNFSSNTLLVPKNTVKLKPLIIKADKQLVSNSPTTNKHVIFPVEFRDKKIENLPMQVKVQKQIKLKNPSNSSQIDEMQTISKLSSHTNNSKRTLKLTEANLDLIKPNFQASDQKLPLFDAAKLYPGLKMAKSNHNEQINANIDLLIKRRATNNSNNSNYSMPSKDSSSFKWTFNGKEERGVANESVGLSQKQFKKTIFAPPKQTSVTLFNMHDPKLSHSNHENMETRRGINDNDGFVIEEKVHAIDKRNTAKLSDAKMSVNAFAHINEDMQNMDLRKAEHIDQSQNGQNFQKPYSLSYKQQKDFTSKHEYNNPAVSNSKVPQQAKLYDEINDEDDEDRDSVMSSSSLLSASDKSCEIIYLCPENQLKQSKLRNVYNSNVRNNKYRNPFQNDLREENEEDIFEKLPFKDSKKTTNSKKDILTTLNRRISGNSNVY
jgi:hypothetical protein